MLRRVAILLLDELGDGNGEADAPTVGYIDHHVTNVIEVTARFHEIAQRVRKMIAGRLDRPKLVRLRIEVELVFVNDVEKDLHLIT